MAADLFESLLSGETRDGTVVVHLLDGPYITIGGRRHCVPQGSKRLLVFVALHRGPVDRRYTAGTLWPDGTDYRAAGNLRSALWRLNRAGLPLIAADKSTVWLHEDAFVDVRLVSDWAARVIAGHPSPSDLLFAPDGADAVDMLPGWYDDWALAERERLRQRVLHALEFLSRHLVGADRCAEGVEAAMTAVCADPLRESAQRALVEALLAEGNDAQARCQFQRYSEMLLKEMGIVPADALTELVRSGDADHRAQTSRS